MIQQKLDIDITTENKEIIANPKVLNDFIQILVRKIEMDTVGSAITYCYPLDHKGGGVGVTIFQPIAQSYIAIDTYPEYCHANLHIYSCKKYNHNEVLEFVRKFFKECQIEINYNKRKRIGKKK